MPRPLIDYPFWPLPKKTTSEDLEKDVEAFLAAGGQINQVPPSASKMNRMTQGSTITNPRHRLRRETFAYQGHRARVAS